MNIATPSSTETILVLIVGGSLVGLSTSLFLSWHGIPSLLVERYPGTAIHPPSRQFDGTYHGTVPEHRDRDSYSPG